jgi:two-component system cell cycle sensor histidine kinase/response regulator CckA
MAATTRILMIEDDPQDAELEEREIRRVDASCTFLRVDTREGMVAALQEFAPDVILTDHSLPTFAARDALELGRQLAPGTPIIVVTGRLGDEPAVEYLQAGAVDYIVKDHLHRLGPAVLRALDIKRSREAQTRARQLQAATYRIAQVAMSATRLEELLPTIHQIVSELMPAKNFYIALYDEATDLVTFPYFVDEIDPAPAPRHPGRGITEYVLRTGRPLLVTPESQPDLDYLGAVESVGTASVDWLGVPLKQGDRTIGVLAVQTYTAGVRYEEHHKEVLQFVSTQVEAAIERTRAEQALRASEARLKAILHSALDAHVAMDDTGRVTTWNQQAEFLFGWAEREVLGQRLADIIVPHAHREAHAAGLRRFLATGEGPILNQRIELTALRRDGREVPVELAVAPVRVGASWLFSAFVRDITARRAADEALRASEKKFGSAFQAHPSPMAIARLADARWVDVNESLLRLFGRNRAETVGHSGHELGIWRRDELREQMLAQLRAGAVFRDVEVEWLTSSGETRTGLLSAEVIAFAGEPHFLLHFQDMTERKLLETQLRQAQKMEAIGRLAGGVAHDFNNVLTAIFGYVDLLREEIPADSTAQRDLAEVRKASERAASLTKQLLAFSRQQVLEPMVLEPNALVEDFEKMLHRLIGEDVELRLSLARDAGNVLADPGQLQQVLMNLVVNARDAMPTGGKLILETANTELSEQYAELHQPVVPGRYVMLAVSDTGMGMTPETRARIFEPFFTTKEKGKGTGLGLSTVYGIIKQSGGYVWVYSEPGRGTTFKIYLPRVDAAPDAMLPAREPATVTGTETILLAEDDEVLRPLARGLLEKLGYQVLDAADAAAALEAARRYREPIHLLLTDVVMPGVSGRELARELEKSRPDTRVLYVSGYTDDAIVHHGMLEPGLNFLQKPFTPASLARKVREVLDTKP